MKPLFSAYFYQVWLRELVEYVEEYNRQRQIPEVENVKPETEEIA